MALDRHLFKNGMDDLHYIASEPDREGGCAMGKWPRDQRQTQTVSRMAPAAMAIAPPICTAPSRSPNHHENPCANRTDEFLSVTIAPAPPRVRQKRNIQNERQHSTPAAIIAAGLRERTAMMVLR